ncbi:MAG: cobyrinate a,c-diamide synthase [Clostridia bacterium]|nr:cobyrinate a,c-diamide synthase [Clostridia bacterium]
MSMPRIMLAGTHSGVGKTTLTTALLAALTRKGYRVQPFKVGPDYIDPGYHKLATGRFSRNLDSWMLGEDGVRELFARSAVTGDFSVIEGVMGLYDGASSTNDFGSSAHVAKILKTPVILVLDVKSMARSAAAVVLGYLKLDPEVPVAGIILNKVGGYSHYQIVKEAIESQCDVPIVGYLLKNKVVEMPERHLGLVPTGENGTLGAALEALVEEISKTIDLNMIIEIARSAKPLEVSFSGVVFPEKKAAAKVKIAYALDEAFNFYYRDGLELLEAFGARLVPFSPLKDKSLPPDIGGVYIGGGFPEMFLEGLAANTAMMDSLREAHQQGMPIYAECGGLMYLTRAIIDFQGNKYPMVGLVPGVCRMQQRLAAMGYVTACSNGNNVLAGQGEQYRGHEFHYSTLEVEDSQFPWALELTKNRGGSVKEEGYAAGNLLASYVHVHFGSNPRLARNFVDKCGGRNNYE